MLILETTQPLWCRVEAATVDTYVDERDHVPIKLHLWPLKCQFHGISCVSKLLFILFFPTPLKCKIIIIIIIIIIMLIYKIESLKQLRADKWIGVQQALS